MSSLLKITAVLAFSLLASCAHKHGHHGKDGCHCGHKHEGKEMKNEDCSSCKKSGKGCKDGSCGQDATPAAPTK